jgi:hypothetical protein
MRPVAETGGMTRHLHQLGARPWPFLDPENVAAFTCRHVLEDDDGILVVSHDEDDGAWQLLCGRTHSTDDARVVCLGCIVVKDDTLLQLADLPLGWIASRDTLSSEWARDQSPPVASAEDDES